MKLKKGNNLFIDIINKNNTGIIHKWPHYFDIYHRHFEKFIGEKCTILEIGVYKGGSLELWKSYFGDKARIIGIDIDEETKKFEAENIEIHLGSQEDRDFLRDLKKKIPKIDILIDDGGHTMNQQRISFEELYGHINEGGVYLCEDTHTSYWSEYGGGFRKSGSFLEYGKRLVDHVNAWHIRDNDLKPDKYTRNIDSIHFYDSILVIEKAKRIRPDTEFFGTPENEEEKIIKLVNNIDNFKLRLLGMNEITIANIQESDYDESLLRKELGEQYDGRNWPPKADTMIGYKRLNNIELCIKDILEHNIAGDFIETGVWKGGACIFMRAILKKYNEIYKNIWVADSFMGLPKPNTGRYKHDKNDLHHTFKELAISREEVENNFRKYNLLDHQVKFLEGWFKDTLPAAPIEKLSLLRLDGDMYESTIDALYNLYPKLSTGGYCIVDDWGAVPACKKAVEDYRNAFGICEPIHRIDWTGVLWKKEYDNPVISRETFDKLKNNREQYEY